MGRIIWFTGLSGAGKTTLAQNVSEQLMWNGGYGVQVLDGDVIRKSLCENLGYSKEDRVANGRRVGFVARLLASHGIAVAVATISPYAFLREEQRQLAEAEGHTFTEVFVSCPLQVLQERDTKGLYAQAFSGELDHFTGVSDPYESPTAADVVVYTDTETVERSVEKILLAVLGVKIGVR